MPQPWAIYCSHTAVLQLFYQPENTWFDLFTTSFGWLRCNGSMKELAVKPVNDWHWKAPGSRSVPSWPYGAFFIFLFIYFLNARVEWATQGSRCWHCGSCVACSPCVSAGSLQVLRIPPTDQRLTREMIGSSKLSVRACVGVNGWLPFWQCLKLSACPGWKINFNTEHLILQSPHSP